MREAASLFQAASRRGLLDALLSDVRQCRNLISVRGNPGVGKTSLLAALAAELAAQGVVVVAVNGAPSPAYVERLMIEAGGIAADILAPGQLHRNLQAAHGPAQLAMLFDDAEALSEAMFRFLGLLIELSHRTGTALSVVLAGQMGAWAGLSHPDLDDMRRATLPSYLMPSLKRDEAIAYLEHLLGQAGRTRGRVMTRKAMTELVDCAHCVPARLNAFAERALIHAYRNRRRLVTAWQVRACLSEGGGSRPMLPPWLAVALPVASAVVVAVGLAAAAASWLMATATVMPPGQAVTALAPPSAPHGLSRPPHVAPAAGLAVTKLLAGAALSRGSVAEPASLAAPAPAFIEAATLQPPPAAPTLLGSPGLLLLARPGDDLQGMFERVYRGVTPPPFSQILAANPFPIRPGSMVIFPAPPGGWKPK